MRKLSKKERNKVYAKALNNYDSYTDKTGVSLLGACEVISIALTGSFCNSHDVDEETFPELMLFKDDFYGIFFLDNKCINQTIESRVERRKLVLMFCIEMTS